MSYPNLRAELVEKMKTDRTDARVGPQIKGHPEYEQWQPPLPSLSALNVSELEPGLLSAAGGEGDIFQIPEGYLHTCSVWGRAAQGRRSTARFQPTKETIQFQPEWWTDWHYPNLTTKTKLCKHLHIRIHRFNPLWWWRGRARLYLNNTESKFSSRMISLSPNQGSLTWWGTWWNIAVYGSLEWEGGGGRPEGQEPAV